MPKIGDFGTFRDDKGHELPCVITRVREDGNVDLHILTTNAHDVEVSLGGPRTVTVIGGVLPIDWGKDVTPPIPAPAPFAPRSPREISDMGPPWNDSRISGAPLPSPEPQFVGRTMGAIIADRVAEMQELAKTPGVGAVPPGFVSVPMGPGDIVVPPRPEDVENLSDPKPEGE